MFDEWNNSPPRKKYKICTNVRARERKCNSIKMFFVQLSITRLIRGKSPGGGGNFTNVKQEIMNEKKKNGSRGD